MSIRTTLAALFALAVTQTAFMGMAAAQGGGGGAPRLAPLKMETEAFPDGGVIPGKYTSRGENVQPAFKFSGAPDTAQTYAIILHDIDVALRGSTTDVLHWMAWNIPASSNGIPEGSLPAGSVQGKNIRGQTGYMGPGAPPGPYHHYVFELYALDGKLDLTDSASREDLLKAMDGHVVAKAAYVGRYHGEQQQ
jgi:Raf kinase inhibitor-like YbhB/YbcL family protein